MLPKRFAGLAACFIALATPAGAVVTGTERLDAFGKKAAAALDTVGRFDDRVALDWKRPAAKSTFPFYGKDPGAIERVECEESQQFHIVANGLAMAQFNVGACKRQAKRARDLAVAAEKELSAFKEELKGMVTDGNRTEFEKRYSYGKVSLRGGMTGYAFTVVMLDRGADFINSAVVFDPKRQMAFIVQGNVTHLCGAWSPDGKLLFASTPFCPETSKSLLDVAADLAGRY